MTSLNEEERSLRAYLLGETAPDEQRRIEERLLLDGDYVELLQITEAELIDGYVRDTLSEREREQFQKHVLTTPERWRKLRKAKALRRYVNNLQPLPAPVRELRPKVFWQPPLLTPAWRSAIAAMLVLGLAIGIWRGVIYQSLTDKGRRALQAALRESPTEARIAGFQWTPQSTPQGSPPDNNADKPSLDFAFSYFREAKEKQPGPDSQYALGQFYLAKGELDTAIKCFEEALAGLPKNAKLHSDLGAALLEKDKADPSSDYRSQSLEHLDKALELDGSLLEALFNRALCYQRMQLWEQAEAAWREYLRRDPGSPWAEVARRHLDGIEVQKPKTSQSKEDQFNEFRSAHQRRDRVAAWKIVSQTRDLKDGRLIWWKLLDNFFERLAADRPAEADDWIAALQYVGELELRRGLEAGQPRGDPYISELAEYYRKSSPQQRLGLLKAHEQMNEGLQFYSSPQFDAALGKFKQARQVFERLHDQREALLADLLISYWLIQKDENEQARSLLEELISKCQAPGYLWLLAHSSFGLGMAQDRLTEHSKALHKTNRALEISEYISDAYNMQRSLAQIADQYKKLGNYESATKYLDRCLEQMSAVWPGDQQGWRNYDQLTQVLSARRLNAAAAAYASEALRLALAANPKNDSNISVSYVHLALIRSRQQDFTEALNLAQLGFDAAPKDSDKAYAALQLGHVRSQAGDLRQALQAFDQSINYIESQEANTPLAKTNNLPALRYDANKGRLFCLFELGEKGLEKEALDTTLGLLEKHRDRILEEQNRNTFFNVEQSVYDARINFEYAKSPDNPAVFAYSEESRARSLLGLIATSQAQPMKLADIQQRLPEQTQLIEYVALDDKLLICLVSKTNYSVKAVEIGLDELTEKVTNYNRLILRHAAEPVAEAQELYNLLISPINLSPENGRQLCIVPDKVLNNLSFLALLSPDSGSYLIEDFQPIVDPSATIYIVLSERTGYPTDRDPEHVLAVGNPAFDRKAFPWLPLLPTTGQQVREIAKLYQSPTVLTDKNAREEAIKGEMEIADLIQFSTHGKVYEGNAMKSGLLLAQEPGDRSAPDSSAGLLQADEVYGLKLRRAPLVILAACQSGVENYYNGEGMIGMSRAFIAAGARAVVASLWPVDVYATDALMLGFHRHRKRDPLSASGALRAAQRDMLKNPLWRHPFYWAGFIAIGGNPDA